MNMETIQQDDRMIIDTATFTAELLNVRNHLFSEACHIAASCGCGDLYDEKEAEQTIHDSRLRHEWGVSVSGWKKLDKLIGAIPNTVSVSISSALAYDLQQMGVQL